ncbi:formylglycine-generating enzyme family protein [Longimicrobium sp.]|uniref:formylglycine-generating enzyme family protein n=1 Tax=Longimicrobium sp. TaxID=2029185 RepID=UPI002E3266B4|nr:formylglycine-generating enzyme family protein [Longimicrobium sp.]HEX6037027.1 formylglycine-generating enzyme family protein [Longimicrobium sp.]
MRAPILLLLLGLALPMTADAAAPGPEMARIPGGTYVPQFVNGPTRVRVAPFAIDRVPVTRADYLAFVQANARWRRGQVRPVYAGPAYLADWAGPLAPGARDLRRPVTQVSWFAARAFCAWRGKRLPTTDEWEYVGRASETRRDATADRAFLARLLELATRRRTDAAVGSTFRNAYGVWDMHGLVWEWTADFNNLMISGDSRATGGRDHPLFCAAGVIGATDPDDYPAYLRYGFRATLEGRTTEAGLGFRCAQDV